MTNKEKNQRVYSLAYNYLLDIMPKQLNVNNLYKYFIGDRRDFSSLSDVYEQLIQSAQNSQGMPNVIKFSERKERIRNILFDYSFTQIIKYNVEDLYQIFRNEFNVTSKDSNRNSWRKWSKSIIDAAKFMCDFENVDAFKTFVNQFDYNLHTRMALPLLISTKISGIGFTLACDFLKAKAVAQWLFANVFEESCEGYAATTMHYFRLAGFPAKEVGGEARAFGWEPHVWNHVFVDGRWVFVDTMAGKFDPSVEEWSKTHILSPGFLNKDWDGTITIYDMTTKRPVLTVEPVPIGTLLGEVKDLSLVNLYLDVTGNVPVRATDKFSAAYHTLWTKTHSVSFFIPAVRGIEPFFVKEEADGSMYAFLSVPHGARLPDVKPPTKDDYTFIGWRDLNNEKAPIWNEYTDVVTEDMSLIAVFQKGTINYTVTFNSNGGSAVKSATVKANGKVTKPADPTRSGYKFTGWYLDSACTENWDFSKNIVRKNITLYAGWERIITAKPTTSKVIVNDKEVTFEAYNINGSNYFKLRDFAQAVKIQKRTSR